MRSVRKKTYSQLQIDGKLELGHSFGDIVDGIIRGTIYVTLKSDTEKYLLHLSECETDYYKVPRTPGGVILSSGQVCHVRGFEKDGEIEVTELKFTEEQNKGGALAVPILYFLPSTSIAMKNKAWVRDSNPNDESDL